MARAGQTPDVVGIPVVRDIGNLTHFGDSTHVVLGFFQHMEKTMRVFYYKLNQ